MRDDVREVTLELRRRHPTWGPKKLLAWLEKRWPDAEWPSASAVGELLHHEGWVRPRKARRRRPHPGRVVSRATAPNEPGRPEQNGAHERMHRTLKAETASPASGNRAAQQRRFNRFRTVYNRERPHEALGMSPPSAVWKASLRSFPSKLPEPSYSPHALKRKISAVGTFAVYQKPIYLSTALSGHWIALEETDNGVWSITFHDVLLGRYHEQERRVLI